MNPGDIERVMVTSFGYWRVECVHSVLGEPPPDVRGRGGHFLWEQMTRAGFGGFDTAVRLRIKHGMENQELTAYSTALDATNHTGQTIDEPEIIAGVMRWYVDNVLPSRIAGMRSNWTKDVL